MYTVLIMNEESNKLFQTYKNLFAPFIDQGQIGICLWNSGGGNTATAIPDIYNLVEGKSDWRAIVLFQLAVDKITYKENPFDFCNKDYASEAIEESEIPLIRLVHMLLGFPRLGIKAFKKAFTYKDFETGKQEMILEQDMTEKRLHKLRFEYKEQLKTRYIEVEYTDQERERHRQISKKYDFLEERPYEVLLATIHPMSENMTKSLVAKSWKPYLETQSSMFWKNNNYPIGCRFVSYQIDKTKYASLNQALIGFWSCILVLAVNRIPPSILQAYRLYNMSIEWDKPEMSRIFNDYLNILTTAHEVIDERLAQESQNPYQEGTESFLKHQEIPIILNQEPEQSITVEGFSCGLAADLPEKEIDRWQEQMFRKKRQLEKYIRRPKKAIANSAEYLKERIKTFEHQEYHISKHTIDELDEEMIELKQAMIDADTANAVDQKQWQAKLAEKDRQIQKEMHQRMHKSRIWIGFGIAFGAVLIGFIPYWINSYALSRAVFLPVLVTTLIATGLVLVFGVGYLLLSRRRLRQKIEEYNNLAFRLIEKINSGVKVFEDYLGDLCTYMKADAMKKSYLNKVTAHADITNLLYSHKRHIDKNYQQIYGWQKAFGISRAEEHIQNSSILFDASINPKYNTMYYLEYCERGIVMPINNSGDELFCPYKFIHKFNIERVSIYDDLGEEATVE